jgi:hypothetical protein
MMFPNKIIQVIFILACLSSSVGCDTSIVEYQPKNPDEQEILSLLFEYQDAKNNLDIDRLLLCLHDNGDFTFACGLRVTKNELRKVLPAYWDKVQSGDKSVVPLAHECLNGDYFISGELNNPKISITENTAEARVLVTSGFSRVLLFLSIVREDNQWFITRTEWGRS